MLIDDKSMDFRELCESSDWDRSTNNHQFTKPVQFQMVRCWPIDDHLLDQFVAFRDSKTIDEPQIETFLQL
jgi:hypothetical protein